MILTRTVPFFVGILALTVAGCNRGGTNEEPSAPAADDAQVRQTETMELENRLDAVEREWQEAQAALSKQTAAATAALKTRIQEDLVAAREAIVDLRTTTAGNWWERQERQLERAAADLEADVRRHARNLKDATAPTRPAADTSDWRARRDALLARVEERVDAFEAALRDAGDRDAGPKEVEDTEVRVKRLREDADRLRDASENDWWDVTKQHVSAAIERIDAAIDRLTTGRG
jgi:hypothetical protein